MKGAGEVGGVPEASGENRASGENTDLSATTRTGLRRHRERGRTDRDDLYAVLDAGLICHLGVIADGGEGRGGDLAGSAGA